MERFEMEAERVKEVDIARTVIPLCVKLVKKHPLFVYGNNTREDTPGIRRIRSSEAVSWLKVGQGRNGQGGREV